jgi:hypothetical protein
MKLMTMGLRKLEVVQVPSSQSSMKAQNAVGSSRESWSYWRVNRTMCVEMKLLYEHRLLED